jgi:L-histidine N-alpha-methyltransferase
VDALCRRGSVASVAVAELDPTLASAMVQRIASRDIREPIAGVACDCTVELPLPDQFPRPRVYLCLGNVLGSTTAVGAIRMLRILRTTMQPGDVILLGVDAWRDPDALAAGSAAEMDAASARHLGTLGLLNSTVGATFDLSRFEYRPSYDADTNRLETHVVARRASDVRIPGVADIRLKKGESIRTSVSCTFERPRLSAMMSGVGLTLREWSADPRSRFAVALATTAS